MESAANDVPLVLTVTGMTHQGVEPSFNDDSIAIGDRCTNVPMSAPIQFRFDLSRPVLCLVADGIGGSRRGDVASLLTAQDLVARTPQLAAAPDIGAVLALTNRAVFKAMTDDPLLSGMGTTVAGLVIDRQGARWFNLGDSRICTLRNGLLAQLSTDHVLPASGKHRSHVLTRYLGGDPRVSRGDGTSVGERRHSPPARWMICSDGVTDMLDDERIEACISRPDLEAVEAVWHAAIAAGGRDNISIVVATLEHEAFSG